MALVADPAAVPIPVAPRRGGRLSPGTRYAIGRIFSSIGTLLFVLVFNFFLFRILPGDPVALYTRGRNVDPEQFARLTADLHRPMSEQFVEYLKNPFAAHLNSVQFSQPVWDVIPDYLWPTLLLVGSATILATIGGVWLGIRSGWKRGSRFDKNATNTTLVALLHAGVLVRHDPAHRLLDGHRAAAGDLSLRRVDRPDASTPAARPDG